MEFDVRNDHKHKIDYSITQIKRRIKSKLKIKNDFKNLTVHKLLTQTYNSKTKDSNENQIFAVLIPSLIPIVD